MWDMAGHAMVWLGYETNRYPCKHTSQTTSPNTFPCLCFYLFKGSCWAAASVAENTSSWRPSNSNSEGNAIFMTPRSWVAPDWKLYRVDNLLCTEAHPSAYTPVTTAHTMRWILQKCIPVHWKVLYQGITFVEL